MWRPWNWADHRGTQTCRGQHEDPGRDRQLRPYRFGYLDKVITTYQRMPHRFDLVVHSDRGKRVPQGPGSWSACRRRTRARCRSPTSACSPNARTTTTCSSTRKTTSSSGSTTSPPSWKPAPVLQEDEIAGLFRYGATGRGAVLRGCPPALGLGCRIGRGPRRLHLRDLFQRPLRLLRADAVPLAAGRPVGWLPGAASRRFLRLTGECRDRPVHALRPDPAPVRLPPRPLSDPPPAEQLRWRSGDGRGRTSAPAWPASWPARRSPGAESTVWPRDGTRRVPGANRRSITKSLHPRPLSRRFGPGAGEYRVMAPVWGRRERVHALGRGRRERVMARCVGPAKTSTCPSAGPATTSNAPVVRSALRWRPRAAAPGKVSHGRRERPTPGWPRADGQSPAETARAARPAPNVRAYQNSSWRRLAMR